MPTHTKEQVQAIYEQILDLVKQGKGEEVYERFYAEDIYRQQASQAPMIGKQVNIKFNAEWMKGLIKFNEMTLLSVAYGDDVAMSEWQIDFEHERSGHSCGKQVSVTRFRDGLICDERFYMSNNPA